MYHPKQYKYYTVGIEEDQFKTHCVEFGTDQYFLAMEPGEALEGMMESVATLIGDNAECDLPTPHSVLDNTEPDYLVRCSGISKSVVLAAISQAMFVASVPVTISHTEHTDDATVEETHNYCTQLIATLELENISVAVDGKDITIISEYYGYEGGSKIDISDGVRMASSAFYVAHREASTYAQPFLV